MNADTQAIAARRIPTRNLAKLLGVLAVTIAIAGCGSDSPFAADLHGNPDVPGNGFAQCAGGGLTDATITLSPNSVKAESQSPASVTLTISAPTQFFASDTIFWNGSANGVGTTYVDPSDLTMTVPAALLISSGSSAQITVQETCANGPAPTSQTNPATLMITVGITTTSLPNGVAGAAYSQTLSAAGGTTPYTWSLTSGTLPAGLTLNASTGVISGTPTAAGTANFTVQVTDASNGTDNKGLSILIASAGSPPTVTTASLPNGTVGTAYNQSLTATGGTPPYQWTWMAAAGSGLPPGLSLSSAGTISGTPTAAGTFDVIVQVQDQSIPNPQNGTKQLSLIVSAAAPIAYAPGPVLSAGLLVAMDEGVSTANNNHGVAAVAVQGTLIAAGVPFGTVLIRDPAGNWNAAASLAAPPATPGTVPSIAISGDGNTIAAGFCVGSPCTNNVVYVYEVSGNNWSGTQTPVSILVSSGGVGVFNFGFSVAVDDGGDIIAAGEPTDPTQNGTGAVYVFVRQGASWGGTPSKQEDVQLTAGAPDVGISVGIDGTGDTIVTGAEGFGTVVNAGAAYVFVKPAGGWTGGPISTPTATLTQASAALNIKATLGDYFGRSVAISADGHTIAVGAPNYPNCTEPCNLGGPGAVFVYVNSGVPAAWSSANPLPENAVLTVSGGLANDQLGFSTSVSRDGATIVAGAPWAPNGTCCKPGPGSIYVFQAPPGNWSGSLNATQSFVGTATQVVTPLAQFGTSVSIAGDATAFGAGGDATVGQVTYLFQ